jgi:methyl-accepting chemotaxis protein
LVSLHAVPDLPSRRSTRPAKTPTKGAHVALAYIESLTQGNFHAPMEPGKDPLLAALSRLGSSLDQRFGQVAASSHLVDASGRNLCTTARNLRGFSGDIRDRLMEVISSTQDMRLNMASVSASAADLNGTMGSIASAAQQSTENVASIRRSIEELTTASQDIAHNSSKASDVSRAAMQRVTAVMGLVADLMRAAKDIDVFTATISEISEQTKLLSLNATIEAARAGEAGKGFAVVAKEVKDLAGQTHAATRDIQAKVAAIREATARTVEAMESVNHVMQDISGAITSIAGAAEEQSVTTADIAQNVGHTTDRIREMTHNVREGSAAVSQVTLSMAEASTRANAVANIMEALGAAADQVRAGSISSYAEALEVSSHVGDLRRFVGRLSLRDETRRHAASHAVTLGRYSAEFDVSVAHLNQDHQKIFELVNSIHASIKARAPHTVLHATFRELASFTTAHFSREEEDMRRAAYPELAAHVREHQALLGKVGGYLKGLEAGEKVDLIEVGGFLLGWLVQHILGVDKHYGPALNAAGIR